MDDCFGVIFEALCFAKRCADPLILGAQDVKAASDSVEHVDAISVIRGAGASPHQVLAIAREFQGKRTTMSVPGISKTDTIHMNRALKTGGRIEPKICTGMLGEVLDSLEGEWAVLGIGFTLPDCGKTIPSVT